MKFGVCLPYMEKNFGRKELMQWCKRIDDGPFYALSCGERITGYTLEMRNMLAFAAACTERVQIMPSLYVLPMHSPVWAAKEIATLDVLSEGRVILTVGVGGRENDYRAVGAPFEGRFTRMDQQIAEMRRIWSGEPVFDGADEVGPKPYQAGGPKILVGAMGPKSINRVSHWADGLYGFSMSGDPDEIAKYKDMTDAAWLRSGRDTTADFTAGFWCSLTDNSESVLKNYAFNYLRTFGDDVAKMVADTMVCHEAGAITERIRGIEALGINSMMLVPTSDDIRELDRLEDLIVKGGWA